MRTRVRKTRWSEALLGVRGWRIGAEALLAIRRHAHDKCIPTITTPCLLDVHTALAVKCTLHAPEPPCKFRPLYLTNLTYNTTQDSTRA